MFETIFTTIKEILFQKKKQEIKEFLNYKPEKMEKKQKMKEKKVEN
jgi:hypothetical protein